MFSINALRGSVQFHLSAGEYHVHGFSHGPAPTIQRLAHGAEGAPFDLPADGVIDAGDGGDYRIVVPDGHSANIWLEAL